MLKLNNISAPGSHRKTKRIGRGQGSGRGTQAGKGNKGQKARKSGHVRVGFEGGSMPLYMRLPKRGFTSKRDPREEVSVSLNQLSGWDNGSEVTIEKLKEFKVIKSKCNSLKVKILDSDKFTKKLSFVGLFTFSEKAKNHITSLGGSIRS